MPEKQLDKVTKKDWDSIVISVSWLFLLSRRLKGKRKKEKRIGRSDKIVHTYYISIREGLPLQE